MSVELDKLQKKETEFDMTAKEKIIQIHRIDTLIANKMKSDSDI